MKMTNTRNRIIYRFWAPFCDAFLARFFRPGRVRAMQILEPRSGERLLLVGIGTGVDLPLLPVAVEAVGIDLSAAMLARAKARLPLPDRKQPCPVASDEPSLLGGMYRVVLLRRE